MRVKFALVLALVLALGVSPVAADVSVPGAALVTQSGSTGLAAQTCLTQGTAGSTSAQQTLTVPSPGGGNSIYFDYLSAVLNTIAAPASSAGVLMFTSTNIAGTPTWPTSMFGPVVSGGNSIAATGLPGPLAIPIKALVGTSPTIVGPTANATYGQTITACWHSGP